MYRHTTPVPLKFFAENDPEISAKITLIDFEREVESVWGDYPGHRAGAGRYADLSYDGIPVGRLWESATAVGLLHVPFDGSRVQRLESLAQHWNAAAEIRKSFHFQVPTSDAFDAVLALFDHGPVEYSADLRVINFQEVDEEFYVGRYDPADSNIWCEEMR